MKRRDLLKSAAAAGRGSVTKINKAAAVLATLLLGLFGIGRTATAQAQSIESATSTPAASRGQGNGKVWLRIMAFTDAPVAGADVRVSVHGSQGRPLVDVHAATNKYGVFPVQVRSQPSFFRVEISGGTTNGNPFFGHLSADVVLTDPAHQILVVNPVTTLVSRVLDERPNLKLDGAEARVRTFLTLPANYHLGLALRQGSHYTSRFFSAVAVLTEARDAGGLDAFAHLLLQELLASPTATHSFRPPPLGSTTTYCSTQTGCVKGNTSTAPLLGSTTSTATSVVETGLEAGVLDYAGANNVANLTGWAMSLTGLPGGSSSDIDALVNALVELQSEIEDLSSQVAQLTNLVKTTATAEELNTIVTPASALAANVNGVETQVAYFAEDCPPLPAGSTPTTPDEYCTSEKQNVNTELNDVTIQQAYGVMESYVADNPAAGIRGILHLSSLYLAQTRGSFFRAADSTQMQNLYNYWDSALTQAMNLYIELQHELGAQDNPGAQQMLIDLMGNPNLNPPTTGTFQANEAVNLQLIGQAVPEGTVVSIVKGVMWGLLPWQYYSAGNSDNGLLNPVYPAAGCGAWLSSGTSNFNLYVPESWGWNNGWQEAPNIDDWKAAVSLAPPGTDWQQWLIDQTKTTGDETPSSPGFFSGQTCPHASWAYNLQDPSNPWWAIFPNGQSTFVQAHSGDKNLAWPYNYNPNNYLYFWTN